MKSQFCRFFCVLAVLFVPLSGRTDEGKNNGLQQPESLVRDAVGQLVRMQEVPGQWPYVDSERVVGGLPVGFRIAGTSIVSQALMFAAPGDSAAKAAVQSGLAFVLKMLPHPLMEPSTNYGYDFRVWGHSFALQFLCQVRARKAAGEHEKEVNKWIPRLIDALTEEQLPDGGWNYALNGGRISASFVTAVVVQSLLLARSQGGQVSDELFVDARKLLESARSEDGAFAYSGVKSDTLPGSAARSTLCETTLVLLGGGSIDAVRSALDNFHEHWEELEARRRQPGNHGGPYGIAPYYYYFGHRYAAQAIQLLPEKERRKERERLLKLILQTRDADGTWNDLIHLRGRYYGTAMVALALLGDRTPLPPKLAKP